MEVRWVRHFDQNGKCAGWVNLEKVESISIRKIAPGKDKIFYVVYAWIGEGCEACYWLFVSEIEAEAQEWLEKFMESLWYVY